MSAIARGGRVRSHIAQRISAGRLVNEAIVLSFRWCLLDGLEKIYKAGSWK